MRKQNIVGLVVLMSTLLPVGLVAQVSAQMSSTNYQVDEAQFGSGASLEQCGTAYCAKSSLGDLTVGNGKSDNYSAQFGFNTTDVPVLEVSVTPGVQNMGVISTDSTGTASSVVSVRSYLSTGYVLQITGTPPKNGSAIIDPMLDQDISKTGVEQFGLNVVDNSDPDVGADVVQVPASEFSFGEAEDDYATPNQFKYVEGDTVASSLTSSGRTDYTVSMIMNISNVTPGGQYVGAFSAVVVPVY